MSLNAVLAILGLAGVCALLWWAMNWDFARFRRKGTNLPLLPESRFQVRVTESEVVAQRPDGSIERVTIGELKEIYIVTTSTGPWTPDVWWLLVAANGAGCSFPSGATGEEDAMRFAQGLLGFDNATFTAAMGSTADAKFLCWRAAA
jgi:hypothetical protein